MKKHSASEIDSHIPLIKKSRKPKQAVVSVEDILCPVGLVPSTTKWFKVACNDRIFKDDMRKTAGSVINL